jgi:hypothetical protein
MSKEQGMTELSLAVLSKLARSVFENKVEFENYQEWKDHISKRNANACYWFQLIKLETLLFSFVKSLRDPVFLQFA